MHSADQLQTETPPLDKSGLGGHPRGLTTLFFTEMWERFSYYGMRALLVLYMMAPADQGGLSFDMVKASSIYGTYTMLVYMTSIPGGFIADRIMGQKLAVLIGGLIIAAGHFSMAVPSLWAFYLGLGLIVVGTGLLKPNISTMLGGLYGPNDARRDAGFSIFYMGINIGAALSPLVCGFLAQSEEFKKLLSANHIDPNSSWHFGFATAGVGMLFGLAHYVWQRQRLATVGLPPKKREARASNNSADAAQGGKAQPGEPSLTAQEWQRLGAISILFFFNMLFWSIYEQGGSSLNVFADRLTVCQIGGWEYPSSWFQSLPAVYVIFLAPVFSWLWVKLGKNEPSSPTKFLLGLVLQGLGIALMVPAAILAAQGKVSSLWLVSVYFLQVLGEMCLSPVGLSTVTKLAPKRFAALTMGVWFLGMAFGNALAGWLAGFFKQNDPGAMTTLFGGMAVASFVCALVLGLLTKPVKRLMSGVH